MALVEDKDIQRRGSVLVAFDDGTATDVMTALKVPPLVASLPMRVEGSHICSESAPHFKLVVSIVTFVANNFSRVRIRYHYGRYSISRREVVGGFPW